VINETHERPEGNDFAASRQEGHAMPSPTELRITYIYIC
jgi:hypothetical protein